MVLEWWVLNQGCSWYQWIYYFKFFIIDNMCLLFQSEGLTAEYLFVCLHFIIYKSADQIWIEAGTILISNLMSNIWSISGNWHNFVMQVLGQHRCSLDQFLWLFGHSEPKSSYSLHLQNSPNENPATEPGSLKKKKDQIRSI